MAFLTNFFLAQKHPYLSVGLEKRVDSVNAKVDEGQTVCGMVNNQHFLKVWECRYLEVVGQELVFELSTGTGQDNTNDVATVVRILCVKKHWCQADLLV